MKADPRVIGDLQTTCGILASMAEQLRVDCIYLKCTDNDWLAGKCSKWYSKAEEHLEILIEDLIVFDTAPSYAVAKVQGSGSVSELVARDLSTAQAAFDQLCKFRTTSMAVRADRIPDDYEHAIQFLMKMIAKLEAQRDLVSGLGEPSYVGARLADG